MKTTHAELANLLEAYAVHGGDAASSVALARKLRETEIVALSIGFSRRTKSAAYRIATLADGTRWLAVRYGRRPEWTPVFSVARLDRLVSHYGWTLRSEVA